MMERKLNVAERVHNHHQTFPHYPRLGIHNGALFGFWIIGAMQIPNPENYYGAYPYGVLKRIMSFFPDAKKILHLFAGTIPDGDHDGQSIVTYDIKPDNDKKPMPTICDDVRNILAHKEELGDVDLIIADPPYDIKDFEIYECKPFDKSKAIRDLGEIAKPGCWFVWLDLIAPMYNKYIWELKGHIGLAIGTNTRVRALTFWERTGSDTDPRKVKKEESERAVTADYFF